MEVIRRLAERGPLPAIIMLTGEGNVATAVEALKLGASDYIVKDTETKYFDLLPVVIEQVLAKQRLVLEQQRTFKALQESEERYRSLVELSPDGIILHAGGKLLFANPAAARYLGAAQPEDLIGQKVLDFVHPDFLEVAAERIRLLEKQADCAPWIEEKLVRLDNRELEVEIAAAPSLYQGIPAVQEIFRDIKEQKLAARRLEHMAMYDGLTDLPNRTLFFDRLRHTFAVARRNKYSFALLFIDLDGFKQINDTWGHDVGDLLLKETAVRLVSSVRDSDTVARMGGDEFTVILTRVQQPPDPGIVAGKIIAALGRPFLLRGLECGVSASIGISWYPGDGDDLEELLNKADAAMYRVKESGKCAFRFFAEPTRPGGAGNDGGDQV
jgi:diguanylate cyclase (GGDEF)-like protein/PAS domain S-box-containing protein